MAEPLTSGLNSLILDLSAAFRLPNDASFNDIITEDSYVSWLAVKDGVVLGNEVSMYTLKPNATSYSDLKRNDVLVIPNLENNLIYNVVASLDSGLVDSDDGYFDGSGIPFGVLNKPTISSTEFIVNSAKITVTPGTDVGTTIDKYLVQIIDLSVNTTWQFTEDVPTDQQKVAKVITLKNSTNNGNLAPVDEHDYLIKVKSLSDIKGVSSTFSDPVIVDYNTRPTDVSSVLLIVDNLFDNRVKYEVKMLGPLKNDESVKLRLKQLAPKTSDTDFLTVSTATLTKDDFNNNTSTGYFNIVYGDGYKLEAECVDPSHPINEVGIKSTAVTRIANDNDLKLTLISAESEEYNATLDAFKVNLKMKISGGGYASFGVDPSTCFTYNEFAPKYGSGITYSEVNLPNDVETTLSVYLGAANKDDLSFNLVNQKIIGYYRETKAVFTDAANVNNGITRKLNLNFPASEVVVRTIKSPILTNSLSPININPDVVDGGFLVKWSKPKNSQMPLSYILSLSRNQEVLTTENLESTSTLALLSYNNLINDVSYNLSLTSVAKFGPNAVKDIEKAYKNQILPPNYVDFVLELGDIQRDVSGSAYRVVSLKALGEGASNKDLTVTVSSSENVNPVVNGVVGETPVDSFANKKINTTPLSWVAPDGVSSYTISGNNGASPSTAFHQRTLTLDAAYPPVVEEITRTWDNVLKLTNYVIKVDLRGSTFVDGSVLAIPGDDVSGNGDNTTWYDMQNGLMHPITFHREIGNMSYYQANVPYKVEIVNPQGDNNNLDDRADLIFINTNNGAVVDGGLSPKRFHHPEQS